MFGVINTIIGVFTLFWAGVFVIDAIRFSAIDGLDSLRGPRYWVVAALLFIASTIAFS